MRNIYFVGTAGSGKSTMVGAFREWLECSGVDSVVVNLDPGADRLPYEPDIDIREWVSLAEVMDEYSLGPNGAQIVAADLMAANIDKLTDALSEIKTKYALIDTPGQLELFAFRESSRIIMRALDREKSMIAYLSDPALCKSPNGFIASMVLSSLVQFRLGAPMMHILSKADMLSEEESERLLDWFENKDTLYGDLLDEDADPQTVVGSELFRALEDVGVFGTMRLASAAEGAGMEDIYATAQLAFFGGEDADFE
ncbi:MAG: ATP/GTP-binding protein [Candidatus Methanoplasma sp.]|jgi:GTPase SAR1 family protein|nr:ATP/GTP-binding protein [Candidatus Methanoplasma sp.]